MTVLWQFILVSPFKSLEMSAGDQEAGQKSISTQLMQNPDLLAALQVRILARFIYQISSNSQIIECLNRQHKISVFK